MIEMKKYTMPTYDPSSLDDNRSSDFTRRIPTGLSDRQAARDAKIISQLIRAWDAEEDGRKLIDIFCRKARLLSNPAYWETLRTVWIAAGSTGTAPMFSRLMRSPRPCKSWFMTPEDAGALDGMQFPLTVWRAYNPDSSDEDPGISWTIDEQWCRGYAEANVLQVKQMQVERKDVFAYVSRCGEEEMIILQKK